MDKWFENLKEGRRFAALLLSIGLIQIAGYWFAGALVNGPGPLAIPQPDTSLYCQAALRVAEGHPFSYSEGTAVCTGTTSVLYPFVLAIPSLMGFTGESLVSAGFWLNALFYLVFLAGWGYWAWRRFDDPVLSVVAGVALALFPQTAYCALAQSDTGFWMAASGLLAAALAMEKPWFYGTMLVLGPWVRPEGMICVLAFALLSPFFVRWRRSNLLISGLGLASVIGVFALNYALTGRAQFSSVANKGYFVTDILSLAIQWTTADFLVICRNFLFGQATAHPRVFYAIPFLSAILVWLGVFVHNWRREDRFADFALLLAIGGGILSVAQSGWQSTNVDRYLAWITPLITFFMAEGMVWAWTKLRHRSSAAILALVAPLLFSAATCVTFWALFNATSEDSQRLVDFGRDLDKILPRHSALGVVAGSGIAYSLPERRIAHLSGIYSPEFSDKNVLGNLEILKNEPGTRFDFWLFTGLDDFYPNGLKDAQGRQIAVGPDGMEVRRADWRTFDRGAVPHAPGLSNLTQVARLDVGYRADEKRYDYEVVPRYRLRPFDAIGRVEKLAGTNAFDVGRVVFGEDEMTLPLLPGKDVTFVMRTVSRVSFTEKTTLNRNMRLDYAYSDPLELHIEVDGVEACHSHAHLAKDGFTDAVFHIPGKAIVRSPCRISLHGDHVAFGYWFFQ